MLTIDDFTTGRPWPPPSDAPRQARYNKCELMYEGELDKVFGRWVRLISGDKEETHYALKFPARLSNLWADLVFGEAPAITVSEPEPEIPDDADVDPLTGEPVAEAPVKAVKAPEETETTASVGPSAKTNDKGQPVDSNGNPIDRAVAALQPEPVKREAPPNPRQDALNDLLDKVRLNTAGREAVVDISRFGDGVIKLGRDEPDPLGADPSGGSAPTPTPRKPATTSASKPDGPAPAQPEVEGDKPKPLADEAEIWAEAVNPKTWFPIKNPFRPRRIDAHVLAWEIEAPVDWVADTIARIQGKEPEKRKRLVVEVHERGKSTYNLYELGHGGRIGDLVQTETEDTGLTVPIVFHLPGQRTSGKTHGTDDYSAVASPLEYILWNMAARQSVILKHQDPSIVGPPGQLKTDERTGELTYDAGSHYFEIEDAAATMIPQYLTWDGKLEASAQQVEMLWSDMYHVTETSPAAFNATADGYAESGTSLKLRMTAPLKKAERITENIDPVYRAIIRALGELAGEDFDDVTIEWRDGLPGDDNEASEISERDLRSGLTSKLSERMRRYGMTEQQARDEQARIDEETAAAGPSPMEKLLGMPTVIGDDPDDPLGLTDPNTPPKGQTPPQLASSAAATKKAFKG